MTRKIVIILLIILFTACAEMAPKPFEPSTGHISTTEQADQQSIPELVQQIPVLPEPEPPVEQEKYTVVVNEVPVKELLFALARDAKINVDIDPRIEGLVTINAVEQNLTQLLDRISRQVDLRYEFNQENLIIMPDEPFFRTYKVNYLNITRDTSSNISTDTGVGGGSGSEGGSGGGGGGNTSTTAVTSALVNHFLDNLVQGISAILGAGSSDGGVGTATSEFVIAHPETGILLVKANTHQHELIQQFIDNTVASALRQVLIQATIVEVTLSDKYQAGIDWSIINNPIAEQAGIDVITSTFTGVPVGTLSSFILGYSDSNIDVRADPQNIVDDPDTPFREDMVSRDRIISTTLSLLEEFGDVSVLSSPQIMALNSQTAILKVVDNIVYFEVQVEPGAANLSGTGDPAISTTAKTVPIGIVLSLVAQIHESDSVILQVRPTISRLLSYVNDPNPELAAQKVSNPVPQLQIREMESILRLNNGQVAVLGGLMQEVARSNDAAIPGVSKIPGVGELFKSRQRDFEKRELVIFLRPIIIRNPSIDSDLQIYKSFLESSIKK